jgi:hypothetical protein
MLQAGKEASHGRDTMTPAFSTAATIRRHAGSSGAIGFSSRM